MTGPSHIKKEEPPIWEFVTESVSQWATAAWSHWDPLKSYVECSLEFSLGPNMGRIAYLLLFPIDEDLSANSFTSRLSVCRSAMLGCQESSTRESDEAKVRNYQVSLVWSLLLHQCLEWKKGKWRGYKVGTRNIQFLDKYHLLPITSIIIIIIKIIISIFIYRDTLWINMHKILIIIICRNTVSQHLFLLSWTQNTILLS